MGLKLKQATGSGLSGAEHDELRLVHMRAKALLRKLSIHPFWEATVYRNTAATLHFDNMRWPIFSVFLALLGFVSALSSAGNRLLVVQEDSSQQSLYSKLWTDLKGKMEASTDIFPNIYSCGR
jgi:hypothetical protein